MKLSDITDRYARIQQGGWVDDIPGLDGLRLKVRGMDADAFVTAHRRAIDGLPRSKRADRDRLRTVLSECLADHILLDWAGMEDDDGKPIPYSKDEATRLLGLPEYGAFADAVVFAANIVADLQDDNG